MRSRFCTSQELCTWFLFYFAMVGFDVNHFSHIIQGYFTGTESIITPLQVKQPCTIWVIYSSEIINSLAPGRSRCSFENVVFKLGLLICIFKSSYDNIVRWISQELTYKSTLVQVMAWCRQATSHYLSQCWPRSMLPYGVTRPQWVKKCYCYHNKIKQNKNVCIFHGIYCLFIVPMW